MTKYKEGNNNPLSVNLKPLFHKPNKADNKGDTQPLPTCEPLKANPPNWLIVFSDFNIPLAS